jgi:hypothetical protein
MIGQGDLLLNNLSPICSFCFNFMGGAQKINKELILNMRNIFAGSHTEHQPFFSGSRGQFMHFRFSLILSLSILIIGKDDHSSCSNKCRG